MATYTQIINKVMRRLREDEISSPTDSAYATLIGDLVNETKREVEDAHKWHALRTQIQVTTAASTNGYSITGAGKRFKFTDPTRRAYNATDNEYIPPAHSAWMKYNLEVNTTTGTPGNYYIEGVDSSGDPKVYFWRIPDGVYTINFDVVVPQADLSAGSDVLTVEEWPVVLGTYAKAIAERGEDSGRTSGEAMSRYAAALSDAIAIDAALGTAEDEWYVD